MFETTATKSFLQHFNEIQKAKEEVYPNLVKPKTKTYTADEIMNINRQVELHNIELTTYDYIIYSQFQKLTYELGKEMERLNLLKHSVKQIFNIANDNINKINIACRVSENVEFMNILTCNYDAHRFAYMKDGGMFFDLINMGWGKISKDHLTKLHYSIRMALINTIGIKAEYTELDTILFKIRTFFDIHDAIIEHESKILSDIAGFHVPVRDSQELRLNKYRNSINRLCAIFAPPFAKVPELLKKNVQLSGDIIIKTLTENKMSDVITDSMIETLKDYAHFCVAKMLIDVRTNGHLSEVDTKMLEKNFNFTQEMFQEFEKELKRTRIDISSKDPQEIKLLIPLMKSKIAHEVFIKAVFTNIAEQLQETKTNGYQ